ncbi:MAG: response regulator transcription factor [Candidatus Aminicenantes bacterium]|nr:response regulator transcription factor [Candidatus Aminicenantes bacterium]
MLLVEDDVDLGNVLKQYMDYSGYDVEICRDGREGLNAIKAKPYNLCILDVMMPLMDGFTLAQKIRALRKDIPFVFLTAKSMKPDRLRGLEMGADDYICKPFEADELLLRIKNILRRSGNVIDESIHIGSYECCFDELALRRKGKMKRLTVREADLIKLLYENKNRVVKRSDILKRLWGDDDYFLGRSLDVFVSRLRKFFHDDESVNIETVRGVGFILRIM